MNYQYQCPKCGNVIEKQMTVEQYEVFNLHYDKFVCTHSEVEKGYVEMERTYSPVQVQFRGKGFTGAGGTIPKMDRNTRVKDLAKKTEAENI